MRGPTIYEALAARRLPTSVEQRELEYFQSRNQLPALETDSPEYRRTQRRCDVLGAALLDDHRGLIKKQVRIYERQRGSSSDEELVAAAYLGFVEALARFDPAKGRLGALAKFWVHSEIDKAFAQMSYPQLSYHDYRAREVLEKMRKLENLETLDELGDTVEVAKQSGLPLDQVFRIRTFKLPSGIDALTAEQRDALGNRVSMADPTAQLVLAKLAMEAFRRRTALDEQRRARQRR